MTPPRLESNLCDISFVERLSDAAKTIVLLYDRAAPGEWAGPILQKAGARFADAFARQPADASMELLFPPYHPADRVILWPLPGLEALGEGGRRRLGGRIAGALAAKSVTEAEIAFDSAVGGELWRYAAEIAYGAALRAYRFAGYRTVAPKADRRPGALRIVSPDPAASATLYAAFKARAEGVHLARDLTAEPPNRLPPRAFAERVAALAETGLEIEILDEATLRALGMGALLAVARGSAEKPFVCVMRWSGGAADEPPLALIGKGVTFDSGGLCIKPSSFMYKLKNDMGGAAAVVAALRAAALTRRPANVVGIIGLVENMPDGDAYRPGDVLTTLSGQTVEVIDTDNEGRLVLADLLAYARQRFAPRALVDIATLTGTARIALGALYAPLFANDDQLAAHLLAAGDAEDEQLWRMPTGPQFDFMFASPIADMTNGRADPHAHAIIAARFLERFAGDTPWAHIDMGATHTADQDQDTVPAGFTGFGAALLDRFLDRMVNEVAPRA